MILAGIIYVLAVLAVVAIGLVAVGRETFHASHELRPAVYEITEAVEFVAERLDDQTAARLTPDDVRWILGVDADLLESNIGEDGVASGAIDDGRAVGLVMDRLDEPRRAIIGVRDVAAVLAARSEYLEAIGAIGPIVEPED